MNTIKNLISPALDDLGQLLENITMLTNIVLVKLMKNPIYLLVVALFLISGKTFQFGKTKIKI